MDNLGPSLEASQFLEELDKISSELENVRKSHVFLLIFHDYAYITREVVNDFSARLAPARLVFFALVVLFLRLMLGAPVWF